MIRFFNDKMGQRQRECRYCIVHELCAYTAREAEDERLAVFERLHHQQNGIWSNSDWRVTTRSAVLVVMMTPFGGWPEDLDECVSIILDQYHNLECGVLAQDALVAFESLYPKTYRSLREKNEEKAVLV